MLDSITFVCFPNVVFSISIVVTAVIIISYLLGENMPDVLIRVFIAIIIILYFISATVTITIWCNKNVHEAHLQLAKNCLLSQAILSYGIALLYGVDMFFNIKRSVESEWVIIVVFVFFINCFTINKKKLLHRNYFIATIFEIFLYIICLFFAIIELEKKTR